METVDKPHRWGKIRDWVKRHKKVIIIVTIALAIVGLTILVLSIFIRKPNVEKKPETVANVVKPEPIPVKYYSSLTGLQVDNETAITAPVTAVMIENSPDARPQSGLKDAEVVFEAIAEGGITRFMVLYQTNKPALIGPVRSVRIYYVNWFTAFDASIAHCGGSAEALNVVRDGTYRDLDQFFNGDYYWRASDRYAPHNLYTSSEKLDSLNAAKGYTSSNFTGFSRVDGSPATTLDATNISVDISSYLFDSSYAYDSATNTYARSEAGEPHLDREGGQITPSVIIAMHVDEYTRADGREEITSIGSGEATIFQNGTAINATWTKTSASSQLIFTDTNGAEIPLVRGQTWIVAVPNGNGDVSWN